MSNILTTENIQKHNTKNRTVGVGEWVLRNGVWAMNIKPEPFYQNYTNEEGTKISRLLMDEFVPNTQYYINLWIDGDSVSYNNGTAWSGCGLQIYYTDGTRIVMNVTGGDGVGWQHQQAITDPTKDVDYVCSTYARNLNTFYRGDSFIIPLTESKLHKTGVLNSGDFIETQEDSISSRIGNGYVMIGEQAQFIEW